ncbi:MAG: hypothetical protein AB7D06_17090 [Pedobacter sp.]
MRIVVTAFCNRPGCPVTEFVDLRDSLTYQSMVHEEPKPITHLQCPCCKGMGTIVKTQEVA